MIKSMIGLIDRYITPGQTVQTQVKLAAMVLFDSPPFLRVHVLAHEETLAGRLGVWRGLQDSDSRTQIYYEEAQVRSTCTVTSTDWEEEEGIARAGEERVQCGEEKSISTCDFGHAALQQLSLTRAVMTSTSRRGSVYIAPGARVCEVGVTPQCEWIQADAEEMGNAAIFIVASYSAIANEITAEIRVSCLEAEGRLSAQRIQDSFTQEKIGNDMHLRPGLPAT
ncbi:hypothetical protein C8F04DRAFT_1188658 [Mycena alexandri]|uniref:Uncharacterized protein n=1 Tax=Mycena alexandri TaxID=1745969 RepID=A0AAD6SKE3_9AGAR|nr:hypothetical protein C8F04DRAFT_1188658 [Mycena alexandri]